MKYNLKLYCSVEHGLDWYTKHTSLWKTIVCSPEEKHLPLFMCLNFWDLKILYYAWSNFYSFGE